MDNFIHYQPGAAVRQPGELRLKLYQDPRDFRNGMGLFSETLPLTTQSFYSRIRLEQEATAGPSGNIYPHIANTTAELWRGESGGIVGHTNDPNGYEALSDEDDNLDNENEDDRGEDRLHEDQDKIDYKKPRTYHKTKSERAESSVDVARTDAAKGMFTKRKLCLLNASSEEAKVTKKFKPSAPSGRLTQLNSTIQHRRSSPSASSFTCYINNECDSEIQQDGTLVDEDDKIKRRPYKTDRMFGVSGAAALSPTEVKAQPSEALSTKETQRGRTYGWTHKDLPLGTNAAFVAHVLPLARKKAGSREGDPWQELSTVDIQAIVDTVYGEGEYEVKEGDAWFGLVNLRLKRWRNGFRKTAEAVVEQYIEDNPDYFPDQDTIKETVAYLLKTQEKHKTKPFHWKSWGTDENGIVQKKGPLQSSLVLCTLALAHYRSVDEYPRLERPFGALILAIQAVDHALQAYESGGFVEKRAYATRFSIAKYGDVLERAAAVDLAEKFIIQLNNRATQYIPTMKSFKDTTWHEIFSTVSNYLDRANQNLKQKRWITPSATSLNSNMEVPLAHEYVLASDED